MAHEGSSQRGEAQEDYMATATHNNSSNMFTRDEHKVAQETGKAAQGVKIGHSLPIYPETADVSCRAALPDAADDS